MAADVRRHVQFADVALDQLQRPVGTDAKVTLNLDNLRLPADAKAWDALTGESIAIADGGEIGLQMKSWEYRVVRVGGR